MRFAAARFGRAVSAPSDPGGSHPIGGGNPSLIRRLAGCESEHWRQCASASAVGWVARLALQPSPLPRGMLSCYVALTPHVVACCRMFSHVVAWAWHRSAKREARRLAALEHKLDHVADRLRVHLRKALGLQHAACNMQHARHATCAACNMRGMQHARHATETQRWIVGINLADHIGTQRIESHRNSCRFSLAHPTPQNRATNKQSQAVAFGFDPTRTWRATTHKLLACGMLLVARNKPHEQLGLIIVLCE